MGRGTVILEDGSQLHLWSEHSPAPTSGPNESDFTGRQRIAQIDRIHTLANRAERTEAARKTHRESLQPPRTSRNNSVVEADRLEKQALLKRLAGQVVENTIDP